MAEKGFWKVVTVINVLQPPGVRIWQLKLCSVLLYISVCSSAIKQHSSNFIGPCGVFQADNFYQGGKYQSKSNALVVFLQDGDVQLMKAWVHDLKAIGYKFPHVKEQSMTAPLSVIPTEGASTLTAPAWSRQYDIVAVINFDNLHSGYIDIISSLHKAYRPLFHKVVFTGFKKPAGLPDHISWIGCNSPGGIFRYSCLANVVEEVRVAKTGGYFFFSYNAVFSHCQLSLFNSSRIWFHTNVTVLHGKAATASTHAGHRGQHLDTVASSSEMKVDISAGQALTNALKSVMPSGKHANHLGKGVARLLVDPELNHVGEEWMDGFYIPQHLATDFVVGALIFQEAEVHYEIAIPNLLGILGNEPFELFKGTFMKHPGHTGQQEYLLLPNGQLQNATFLFHPFNMSKAGALDAFSSWWYDSSPAQECPCTVKSLGLYSEASGQPNVYI